MNTSRNRKWLLLACGIIAIAAIGALVWYFIPSAPPNNQVLQPVADYYPTRGWRTSTPEEQGFDSAKLAKMLKALDKGKVPVNSVLIVRNGYVVLDAYFAPYNGSFPHDLASVTKSVTATLIGIAIDQDKLKVDQPMISFFPDRAIANLDERKSRITVGDLVSMRNGMDSECLNGDLPTLEAMRGSSDWIQAALDRKMIADPNTSWCYDSPGMHILSGILQQATGMTEQEYARQNLFGPLGINDVFWSADPQGYTHGWGNLYLKPQDAAKIGYLWLNQGQWEGKQIVSSDWLNEMIKPRSEAGDDQYGYGTWVGRDAPPKDYFYAVGRLGQYIRVYPSYNLIVVITAQGLNDYDDVGDLLAAAVLSPEEVGTPSTAAQAGLDAALKDVSYQAPFSVTNLPETASAITGRRIVLETNPLRVTEARFEFSDPNVATFYVTKSGGDNEVWSIGLDGKYRFSTVSGEAARGYWADSHTFMVETFEDGFVSYRFRFDGDHVIVESPERGVTLKGQLQ
jgi:CubicO group peptidase (beta-lactamase class C family)